MSPDVFMHGSNMNQIQFFSFNAELVPKLKTTLTLLRMPEQ